MTNATPKYSKGDRVRLPQRRAEAEVIDFHYSDKNESWIYHLRVDNGKSETYQEKHIEQ